MGKKVHIVLSNAGEDIEEGSKDGDKTNVDARRELHGLNLDVTDRMLKKGQIGHNRFVVYVDKKVPQAVLSGSTNWTPTGLCAQSNNAILIESPDLAKEYFAYWKLLRRTPSVPMAMPANFRPRVFGPITGRKDHATNWRTMKKRRACLVLARYAAEKGAPPQEEGRRPIETCSQPPDLDEVFEAIENAKQGALFLAFIPGNPSIVSKPKDVYDARTKDNRLFYLRGAASSPDPAGIFRVDLYHRSSKSDASVRGVENPRLAKASASISSVAGIFATFAKWEAEIYKLGHAVIHDKILVIDPFTDDSVVITGSHNLGFKASYSNDENMLIVRGDRAVAEAYAAHVLDVYEQYRWRWRLQQPLRDAFQKLKQRRPKADPAELWQGDDEDGRAKRHQEGVAKAGADRQLAGLLCGTQGFPRSLSAGMPQRHCNFNVVPNYSTHSQLATAHCSSASSGPAALGLRG